MLSLEKMNFFLKAAVDRQIDVSGVDTTSNVACRGQVDAAPTTLTNSTHIVVSKSQSFVCTRSPDAGTAQNVHKFSEGVVTVQTSLGNYSVLWPSEEVLLDGLASSIDKRLDLLQAKLSDANARMDASFNNIQFKKICAARDANNGKPWELPLACPNGWVKTDLLVNNWWPGGPYGQGDTCRVCYQVGASSP
ncbi:hypothetical protein GCM10027159_18480 [Lysobacter terrae]